MCYFVAVPSVLIVGVSGVGVEIAKNLTLAGPAQVTLYDRKLQLAPEVSNI